MPLQKNEASVKASAFFLEGKLRSAWFITVYLCFFAAGSLLCWENPSKQHESTRHYIFPLQAPPPAIQQDARTFHPNLRRFAGGTWSFSSTSCCNSLHTKRCWGAALGKMDVGSRSKWLGVFLPLPPWPKLWKKKHRVWPANLQKKHYLLSQPHSWWTYPAFSLEPNMKLS